MISDTQVEDSVENKNAIVYKVKIDCLQYL